MGIKDCLRLVCSKAYRLMPSLTFKYPRDSVPPYLFSAESDVSLEQSLEMYTYFD